MRRLNLDYIASATNGEIIARAAGNAYDGITMVEIDNRRIGDDCLFFCLIGARVDAHQFLPSVREKGCHNVVVSDRDWADKIAEYGDMNVILVKDTTVALGDLAERYMDDWKNVKRVAITGSAGKTTTKEFLYKVLSTKFRTGKNLGNYNSDTGIPLTIFNSYKEDDEIVITEVGIGEGRDMSALVAMVKPDNAIITNVGSVHMEFFESSREKLLEAKLRITELMDSRNTLVVNNNVENLSIESIRAHSKGDFNIVTVGSKESCDYTISDIRDNGIDGVEATLIHDGRYYDMVIPIVGAHNLFNAAEAVAIGGLYGIEVVDALEAIKEIDMAKDRLDVHRGKYTIINDSYNANPEALKAAIEIVKNTPAKRKGLIIGSMGELGNDAAEIHREVGRYIANCEIDYVATIGELAAEIADEIKIVGGIDKVHSFETYEDLMKELEDNIIEEGDLFLVKGSNSLGLNRLVQELDNETK